MPDGHHTWRLVLTIKGSDGRFRPKWNTFHGTRQDADGELARLVAEHHKGELPEPVKMTAGQWFDEWLERCIRPPLRSPATYRTYEGVVRNWLKSAFGNILLQRLSEKDLERYFADLKLAPPSRALHHAVIVSALQSALRNRLITRNVALFLTNRPTGCRSMKSKAAHNVWSTEDARKFFAVLKEQANAQYVAYFATALDIGARKQEMAALRWSDLDGFNLSIKRQLIRVPKSNDAPRGEAFSAPKNGSERTIALSEETVALLKAHRRTQAELMMRSRREYSDNGLIFAQEWEHQNGPTSRLGDPLTAMTINRELTRLCRAAKSRRITVHGLRHTCATLMLMAGVPPHVVAQRLGHRHISVTLSIYAHVMPTQQADAASRLAGLLHR